MADQERIKRSAKEWRELLTEEQFRVGVKEGTERAFSPGNFNDEKRAGIYKCVGCGTPLWSSKHKFDSGTGWPSFFAPIGPVETKTDFKLVYPRTECHCAKSACIWDICSKMDQLQRTNAGVSMGLSWILKKKKPAAPDLPIVQIFFQRDIRHDQETLPARSGAHSCDHRADWTHAHGSLSLDEG